jgi:agmatinase
LNGNFILHACLTGVAMRRQGIKDPGFLSELTTEHMQPGAGERGAKEDKAEKVDPDYATGRKNRN